MKIYTYLIILLLSLASCAKNEFDVQFDLPESVNATYRLMYYASDPHKGVLVEVPAPVSKGKFAVKCITRNPAVVYVFKDHNYPELAFYVERGDKITISGDSPEPPSWKVKGNKLSEKWSEWRQANRDALSSRSADNINKAVAAYVKQNPADMLSLMLMLNHYDRRNDESGFLALWNSLDPSVTEPDLLNLSPRTDIIISPNDEQKTLHDFAVNTFPDDVDSIIPAKKRASFLYFRYSSDEDRPVIVQAIKNMVKSSGDSASRLVADISLDTDSMVWIRSVETDSLKNVVKGRLPLGFASPLALSIGLERTPFFIVADSTGRQIYRGENVDKAVEAFKKKLQR